MERKTRLLIDIVKSGLTGRKVDLTIQKEDYDYLLAVASKHHIMTMMYYGFYNSGVEIAEAVKNVMQTVVFNETAISEKQLYYINELSEQFRENNIDCMFLKGGVLKKLYPHTEMRRMGDIDILIKEEQYPQIVNIMKKSGYVMQGETNHELKWIKSGILIELHKRLIPSYNKDFYGYYGEGWRLAERRTKSEYVLKKEDMFIYLFVHFAKHYRDAGIGIIHMCDLWVYKNSYKLDFDYISEELKKLRLYEFFQNIGDTLSVWFENKENTEMTDYITDVILNSGIYGTHDNQVLAAALKTKKKYNNTKKERIIKILKNIFPPFSLMRNRHTVLFKHPYMLPICWVLRWVDLIFGKRERIKNKLNDFSMSNNDNIADYQERLKYVGLDYFE